jgi:DNA-binding CsgD family transcriptional regulator
VFFKGGRTMTNRAEDEIFTFREEQVLGLLTEYLTNEEMSSELHVTYETIRSHLKNIKRKLRVKHKEHLIKYAIDHGYGKVKTA